MNPVIEQIVNIYKSMPLSRKIVTGGIIAAVLIGFIGMFYWANKVEYKAAYSGLTAEDASQIVEKLKEINVPYKLEGGGTAITVPAEAVYDVRLTMAGAGLPKGSGVGYEVFDEADFGTTEFVQKLNRQRALQGELARTIRDFDEVLDAKVMIVLPKDSVFIEETRPPSVSVLLKLKETLDEGKIDAVVHLVASSIEDMTPSLVTVVDTTGNVLFKAKTDEESAEILASSLAKTQLQYKIFIESDLSGRIQSMLERIVGKNKAIVRVSSDMDFSSVDINEEIYDPDERNTPYVRSRKSLSENKEISSDEAGMVSSVNPVVPPGEGQGPAGAREKVQKANDTVNYELSKTTRRTVKPIAELKRLSVAAVIDGKYAWETDETGVRVKKYVPRTDAEMEQFRRVVQKAMGYSENREDQVSVESFPFSSLEDFAAAEVPKFDIHTIQKEYGRTIANVLLVVLLFLLIVRPIIKTVKEISKPDEEEVARLDDEAMALLEADKDGEPDFKDMSVNEKAEFLNSIPSFERAAYFGRMTPAEKTSYLDQMQPAEKAAFYAGEDVGKTANIIKGWLTEEE